MEHNAPTEVQRRVWIASDGNMEFETYEKARCYEVYLAARKSLPVEMSSCNNRCWVDIQFAIMALAGYFDFVPRDGNGH